ncbi:hypothetical protein Scep_030914 [Stephania cephalantha]|uniref:non-specific serine/threonine protein kinase n=1 Tax=Stephania cephalantha TaxID=152367 RepID=A0AAP0E8D1_9MAGN
MMEEKKAMKVGKYEMGRVLGEGHSGKVRLAQNLETGQAFALKVLDKQRLLKQRQSDQIKREIGILKQLRHPNIVRLHEVLASKTKIYLVLEYVSGGELYYRIEKGRLSEVNSRKVFQQLIDAVSYCHDKDIYHRDLKLENILVDPTGTIKISDFGLSASADHFKNDGLLHTICGSPHYVAPEVFSCKGYNGASADLWSCGVILYVLLTGYLPFCDRNLARLYQKIAEGNAKIPQWLSPGAQNLIRRLLDTNPKTRITADEIKQDEWFKQDYTPANPIEEDQETYIDSEIFKMPEVMEASKYQGLQGALINAFELIGMSSSLDLSGLFEEEDVSERKIRFTTNYSLRDLVEKIEGNVKEMGFRVEKSNGKLKLIQESKDQKRPFGLSIVAEVFEINPSLRLVELSKSYGDSSIYRKLCTELSKDLGVRENQPQLTVVEA